MMRLNEIYSERVLSHPVDILFQTFVNPDLLKL